MAEEEKKGASESSESSAKNGGSATDDEMAKSMRSEVPHASAEEHLLKAAVSGAPKRKGSLRKGSSQSTGIRRKQTEKAPTGVRQSHPSAFLMPPTQTLTTFVKKKPLIEANPRPSVVAKKAAQKSQFKNAILSRLRGAKQEAAGAPSNSNTARKPRIGIHIIMKFRKGIKRLMQYLVLKNLHLKIIQEHQLRDMENLLEWKGVDEKRRKLE